MSKIVLTFECRNKFEADLMTFCYEVISPEVDAEFSFSDAEDVRGFLEALNDWISADNFYEQDIEGILRDLSVLSESFSQLLENK